MSSVQYAMRPKHTAPKRFIRPTRTATFFQHWAMTVLERKPRQSWMRRLGYDMLVWCYNFPASNLSWTQQSEQSIVEVDGNVFYKRAAHTSGRPPHQLCIHLKLNTTMAHQRQAVSRSDEADIQLTNLYLNRKQFMSVRAAAQTFNVPRTTLRNRRASTLSRRDC